MTASKVSNEILERAAMYVGVDARIYSVSPTRHRVKLFPIVPVSARTPKGYRRKGEDGNAEYQRVSATGRRINAVCWHGFRDYFRAVYSMEPNARFQTGIATWNGSEDFEARYRETGLRNIGSIMFPFYFAEACVCREAGEAR